MRNLIIGALLIVSFTGKAQNLDTIPKINGEYTYQEVVNVSANITAQKLHDNARMYFIDTYKSANDVVQYNEADKVIGKGFVQLTTTQALAPWVWNVHFTTEISIKDGKYRYRLYNISIDQQLGQGMYERDSKITIDEAIAQTKKGGYRKPSIRLYNDMIAAFKSNIEIIKTYMAKSADVSAAKKDEW